MTPTSLLEDSNRSAFGVEEETRLEEDTGFSKQNAYSTDFEANLSNQRERSMALNSEGLEVLTFCLFIYSGCFILKNVKEQKTNEYDILMFVSLLQKCQEILPRTKYNLNCQGNKRFIETSLS